MDNYSHRLDAVKTNDKQTNVVSTSSQVSIHSVVLHFNDGLIDSSIQQKPDVQSNNHNISSIDNYHIDTNNAKNIDSLLHSADADDASVTSSLNVSATSDQQAKDVNNIYKICEIIDSLVDAGCEFNELLFEQIRYKMDLSLPVASKIKITLKILKTKHRKLKRR